MRKASQDGGDNTSIASGIENENKKSAPGILKSTKNSIKRKVQNFSTESDDTANEPLLHKSKEKSEIEKQSAKFLLSKTKTDFASAKDGDKDKLLDDVKITKPAITDITDIIDASRGSGLKDLSQKQDMSQSLSTASIHNHMNTNVFYSPGGLNTVVTKTQILVEVDTSKPPGYAPSPLIFTTAKIHTDGKIQQIEPVQVTPVPILSTVESGVIKTGVKVKEFVTNTNTTLKSTGINRTDSIVPEENVSHVTSNENVANGSMKRFEITNNGSKVKVSTPVCSVSPQMSDTSNLTFDEFTRVKNGNTSVPSTENKGIKVVTTPTHIQELKQVSHSCSISSSTNTDLTRIPSTHSNSTIAKKNVQSELVPDSRKKIGDKKLATNQPSGSSSNDIALNSDFTSKEGKTTTNGATKTSENKSGDHQENKIETHKFILLDHEQESKLSKINIITKPTPYSVSVSKDTKKNSTETSISDVHISLPEKSISNTANSGVYANEKASNNINNVSIARNSTTLNKNDKVDAVKIGNFIAGSSMKSIPNSTKSSENHSQATSSVTQSSKQCSTGKETSSKQFDSKTLSNVSSVSNASDSTKSTTVTYACVSPQINKVPTTITAKVTVKTNNKNSAYVSTTSTSSIPPTFKTSADIPKLKSNNIATVVSSISKSNTVPSSTNSISQSSSSSITTKSTPTAKQLSSPSTVKTISSVPTVKSAVVGTVHHDNMSTKGVSIPVKPISTVSNKTPLASSTSKKPLATKSSSPETVDPSDKIVATSSKPATKYSTQSDVKSNEEKKDSKSPKA